MGIIRNLAINTHHIYWVHTLAQESVTIHKSIGSIYRLFSDFRKFHSFEMDFPVVIQFQVAIFRFFGMLPKKESLFVLKLWGWIVLLWSGFILVCCQAISIFYVETTNEIVEESILLCTTTSVGIKLALFYWNRKNLPKILCTLIKLNGRVYNEESIRTVEMVNTNCRRTSRIYFFSYLGSLVSVVLQLIFLDVNKRTWKSTGLVPSEFAQQPSVYYGVLIAEAIGNSFNCFLAATIDTYCFQLVSLLAGHIEALSVQLSEYGTDKEARESDPKKLRLLKFLEHFDLLDEYVA